MKIVAFNGSPRGQIGNTEHILKSFMAGAREAGAETETVYLKDMQINHCIGCFTCWLKTPGECVHQDDMPALLNKLRKADLVVYAVPLYIYTVPGLMKDFMDRCCPLLKPYIVKRGEQYIHPTRYEDEWPKKMVLISNCGYPQRHHFAGLVETFRQFSASHPDLVLVASILCAAGGLFGNPQSEEMLRGYVEAARRAGREVVEQNRIMPETQELLDRDLIDPEVYSSWANAYFDSVIAAQTAVKTAVDNTSAQADTLSPALPLPSGGGLPETFHGAITGQAAVFNPAAAGDLRADLQFCVTGQEPGEYVLRIADGRCTAHTGKVSQPALTVHTPSEVWLQITRGELSGATAYLQGLFRAEGNMNLLMRMNELFSTN